MIDYYKILGLKNGPLTSYDEIIWLCDKVNANMPEFICSDISTDDGFKEYLIAKKKYEEMKEAYDTLCNYEKRNEYDKLWWENFEYTGVRRTDTGLPFKDYYRVLGSEFHPYVSKKEIKNQYDFICRKCNPESIFINQEFAKGWLKEATEAYELLTDSDRKKYYDKDWKKSYGVGNEYYVRELETQYIPKPWIYIIPLLALVGFVYLIVQFVPLPILSFIFRLGSGGSYHPDY